MDLIGTFDISASGLAAERLRLQTVASNLANARTTRTAEGGPYQRRVPVFESVEGDPFAGRLASELASVRVREIRSDPGVQEVYDPGHPDAGADGYVAYPDIDVLSEMVDMMTAARSYEANSRVIDTTREMAMRALEIGG